MADTRTRYLTCLLCKHLIYVEGFGGGGEDTPASPPDIRCQRGKWEWFDSDDLAMFRGCLLTADQCDEYVHHAGGVDSTKAPPGDFVPEKPGLLTRILCWLGFHDRTFEWDSSREPGLRERRICHRCGRDRPTRRP